MQYVISGDQHLRYDVPICRTETQEEWLLFQEKQFTSIIKLANEKQAALFLTGDLFDISRVPAEIVNMAVRTINKAEYPVYMISGNHEKLYHREANVDVSSIGVFKDHPKVKYFTADENVYGTRFQHSAKVLDDVTIVHTLCFRTEEEVPFGINCCTAQSLLDMYNTKYIFTGDMHIPFIYSAAGRTVINPGKMTVQNVSEAEQVPLVYILDTDTGKIDKYFLDNPKVSREHILAREERDSRIAAAIQLIKTGKSISLSFKDNLHTAVQASDISTEAMDIIMEIEEEVTKGDNK